MLSDFHDVHRRLSNALGALAVIQPHNPRTLISNICSVLEAVKEGLSFSGWPTWRGHNEPRSHFVVILSRDYSLRIAFRPRRSLARYDG